MVIECPIVIRELADLGEHPPMWGRFEGVELSYCIATMPDGRARRWTRERGEGAEIFSGRIVRDVVERARRWR